MANVYAKILEKDSEQLNKKAKCINNGRVDGTYFYVSSNFVSISNPHYQIQIEEQIEELNWFLEGKEFYLFKGEGIS